MIGDIIIMKPIYKIEVLIDPSIKSKNNVESFFWCLLGNFGHGWCNEGHGWATTYEDAWVQAYKWYNETVVSNMAK